MITIKRGKEPDSLLIFRKKNSDADYEKDMPTNVLKDIREQMWEEQRHLCAYCMRKIDSPDVVRLEHCRPYCKFLDTSFNGIDISSYASVLLKRKANIKNVVVFCKDLQLKPWEMWSSDVEGDNKKNHSPVW